MTILDKLFKKPKDDENVTNEVTQTPTTIPETPSLQNEIIIKPIENQKTTPIVKIRNYQTIDNLILQLLRRSPQSLPTYLIAKELGTNPTSCKHHLERLKFDGLVDRFEQGRNKRWSYWKMVKK